MTNKIDQRFIDSEMTNDAELASVESSLQTSINNHVNNLNNPHSVTKSQVGLSDVDNVSAADLRDRATHTGTQLASTISDFTTAVQTIAITRYSYFTNATATNSNATYTTVAQLTTIDLPVGLYFIKFVGLMQSGGTPSGVGVRVSTGTGTITTCNVKWTIAQGANGAVNMSYEYDQLATTTNITSASTQAANTTFNVTGMGLIRVTVAGTVTIQIRSEVNGTAASLLADSSFILELV